MELGPEKPVLVHTTCDQILFVQRLAGSVANLAMCPRPHRRRTMSTMRILDNEALAGLREQQNQSHPQVRDPRRVFGQKESGDRPADFLLIHRHGRHKTLNVEK